MLHRHSARPAPVRFATAYANLETLEPRRLFAAGDFDPTFGGGDGQAIVSFADATAARMDVMARQSDGKVLIAGHRTPTGGTFYAAKVELVRLEADGDLDLTFGGGDGVVEMDVPADVVRQISLDPSSGRIALATTNGLRVFDSAGNVVAGFDNIDAAVVVYQADGKLLTANSVTFPDPNLSYLEKTAIDLRRYNADGTLDETFGVAGVARIAVSSESNVAWHEWSEDFFLRRMIVATDGSLYVAARREHYQFVDNGTDRYTSGMSIFRLTTGGDLDTGFNAGFNAYGEIIVHFETNAGTVEVATIEPAAGGGVTAVWSSTDYSVTTFGAMTLTPEGAIDLEAFNGKLQLPPALHRIGPIDFGVDPAGRLLLSGMYNPFDTGNEPSYFAARFMPSGLPDYSYDDDGIYLAGPSILGGYQAATLVLPDGSVILAGVRPDGQPVGFIISKLEGGEGTPSPVPTITLNAKGTLMVTTTDAKDLVSLSIRQSDGRLILRSGTFARSFAVSTVKRIAIYTLGGDDTVTIGAGVRGSYVEAGDGADTVNGGQFGDVLLGGLGADQIFGNDGDDTLLGEGGNDYLLGGAGKDDLFGNGGTDILSGAGGNDRLFGGPNEADRILGGAGSDSAAQDDKDSYESIETLLSA
jgi:uncharacterized delta-60 repeat protein